MRSRATRNASLIATLACCPIESDRAFAQATSETSSTGEIYTTEDSYEFGQGSTLQNIVFSAEVNGEPANVALAGLSRYFDPFSDTEIAAALAAQLPQDYVHMVGGVPVTVVGWSAAELFDSTYDVIDVFSSESPYQRTEFVTTTQLTSGDGPDPMVPIGDRSECYSFGTDGPTNFAPFGGFFADCSNNENYFEVAPGTINTHTHTTTVHIDGIRYFQSIDDAYTNSYVVRAGRTLSASSGVLETTSVTNILRVNDLYATRFTGVVGGAALFDQSIDGAFGDAAVQAALSDLSAPHGYGIGGAPAVVLWAAPVRTAASRDLLSTSTSSETSSRSFDTITVSTTEGGSGGVQVLIGDRGTCSDAGTSGATNGAAPSGSFASCEGGVVYLLSPGETNVNTHTTHVTETTTATVVTENWLNAEAYQLSGTPVFVGQIHAAARDVLFDGGDFARRHADTLASALPAGGERGTAIWIRARTGHATTASDAAGPGNRRRTRGGSGGVSVRLSDAARIGIAIDHGESDLDLAGRGERADITLTQLGVAADLSPGDWQIRLAAARGWGSADTERGSAALGGIARADYKVALWSALAEAGPRVAIGEHGFMRPFAAAEWTSADLGSFAETGGIALRGDKDRASRAALSLGVEAGTQRTFGNGSALHLSASARAARVVDGRRRDRAVTFAATPGQPLRVAGARETPTYAALGAALDYQTAGGLGLHLGADGRLGADTSWRVTAGLGFAF